MHLPIDYVAAQLQDPRTDRETREYRAAYALDPTIKDIPPWAFSSAQALQPILRQHGTRTITAAVLKHFFKSQ